MALEVFLQERVLLQGQREHFVVATVGTVSRSAIKIQYRPAWISIMCSDNSISTSFINLRQKTAACLCSFVNQKGDTKKHALDNREFDEPSTCRQILLAASEASITKVRFYNRGLKTLYSSFSLWFFQIHLPKQKP